MPTPPTPAPNPTTPAARIPRNRAAPPPPPTPPPRRPTSQPTPAPDQPPEPSPIPSTLTSARTKPPRDNVDIGQRRYKGPLQTRPPPKPRRSSRTCSCVGQRQ